MSRLIYLFILLFVLSASALMAQATVDAGGFATLAAAIAAAGPGGTVHAKSGYATSLNGKPAIVIRSPITIECDKGATFTLTANVDAFGINSNNVRLIGACTLVNRASPDTATAVNNYSGHSYLEVGGWTFSGFANFILLAGGDHQNIHDNSMMNGGYIPIFAKGNLTNSSIARNHIACTRGVPSSTAIAIFSNGGNVHSDTVDANEITGGCSGQGIVVGNFSNPNTGAAPYDMHITNNHATFTGISGTIAYSFSPMAHSVVSHNIARLTGNSTGYAAFENVSQANAARNNTTGVAEFNSYEGNEAYGAWQYCQTLDWGSTKNVVTGMTCQGFTKAGVVIYNGSNGGYALPNDGNVVKNNAFTASAVSGSWLNGIWIQANASSAAITNTVISGNAIDMSQPTGLQNRGIMLEQDHGKIDSTIADGNTIKNAQTGLSPGTTTHVSGSNSRNAIRP
jgi:hypothetical protein